MKIGLACEYMRNTKKMRSLIHHEVMTDILKTISVAGIDPGGKGTIKEPYLPNKLGHWWNLAKLKWKTAPIFLEVGGRLIARWGKGAGQFRGYCTDVTGLESEVVLATAGKGDYEQYVRDLGKLFKKKDALAKINPKLPSYSRKALRVSQLDDRAAAAWSRRLLTGAESCLDCPELASTVCSLFISEVARTPATFIISLMLLDLVETATTYGAGGAKTYTWKSMLMYGNDRKIPGRGAGKKLLAKHPMAGDGTAKLGRLLFDYQHQGVNRVRDRVISIMSVWLAHYMTRMYGNKGYTFFIIGAPGHPLWGKKLYGKVQGHHRGLRKNCTLAVIARASSSGVLIGGTTVYYQDIKGMQI